MSNTLTFLIVVVGGCWCLKQWLSYLERKQLAGTPAERREGGEPPARTWEIEPFRPGAAGLSPRPRGGKGGASRWIVMALCALYICCPIDFIPDFLPILGWGDDVVAAVIGLRQLFK